MEEDNLDVIYPQSLKMKAVTDEVNNFPASNRLKERSACPSSLLSACFESKVYLTDRGRERAVYLGCKKASCTSIECSEALVIPTHP